MCHFQGLLYESCPRPKGKARAAYGGAAIIVNTQKFSFTNMQVIVPAGLEVIWGMIKPKMLKSKFKKIIVCSFYSPPGKRNNVRLADHLTSTLHMLTTKHPESGIIMGADINSMKISPLLNCGLKLRQIVDQKTHGNKIIDVIFTNLSGFYKSPIIAPPIQPDNPSSGEPSDHYVPVCIPHSDSLSRP